MRPIFKSNVKKSKPCIINQKVFINKTFKNIPQTTKMNKLPKSRNQFLQDFGNVYLQKTN